MLRTLEIRNFVLIDKVTVRFSKGFNVITGETGAGKSILISALELVTGEKGSTRLIGGNSDKLTVIATFDLSHAHPTLFERLREEDVEPENNELVIRREITTGAKSRSFINRKGVRVSQLKNVGDLLVDIHGQHEHQSLFAQRFHVDFYDAFIGVGEVKARYYERYRVLHTLLEKARTIRENREALEKERSFLEYAVEEIEGAQPRANEDAEVTEEINRLNNAEKIDEGVSTAYYDLYESDESVEAKLGALSAKLESLAEYDARLGEAAARIEDVIYRVGDARDIVEQVKRDIRFDPKHLDTLNERLYLLTTLKKKYKGTLADVIEYGAQAREKLSLINFSEEDVEDLAKRIKEETRVLCDLAEDLSRKRQEGREAFVARIEEEMNDLGMGHSRFDVEIVREEADDGLVEIGGTRYRAMAGGIDRVEFLIAPNKSEVFLPLRKIASGGEVSRIMLALKTVLAEGDFTETMIFDEIDTGVGGGIAEVVGEKIERVGRKKQVIAITHLPQIASHAFAHFVVAKEQKDDRILSSLAPVKGATRTREIARMLGGKQITETTLKHAKEMLDMASADPLFTAPL